MSWGSLINTQGREMSQQMGEDLLGSRVSFVPALVHGVVTSVQHPAYSLTFKAVPSLSKG